MSRYMDLDVVVPLVKDIAKCTDDPDKRYFFQGIAIFLDGCPNTYMEKLVICNDCYFCDHASMHCIHDKGLQGRLQPNYHCPFGSPVDDGSNVESKLDFSMFDEVEDEADA